MTSGEFVGNLAQHVVNPTIKLLFAAALVVFLWGVVEYIQGAGSPDKRITGTKHIIWGLIGLFIMVSVFGIIKMATSTIFG